MDTKPQISIIVPVYNVELYIEKCINSIKDQSYKNFEAIIVDDGSQDSSINICENLIRGDSRFKIVHKQNGGLMSAWKYGVLQAKGDYIGFVDSDDWIDPTMFQILYDSIVNYNADVVVSGYVTESTQNKNRWTRDKRYIFEGDSIRKTYLKEYCCSYFKSVSHPSINRWDKLYRKNLLLKNMMFFNEKVSMGEDFNMNIPIILDSKKIVLLPDFSPYHYRYNPTSISNSVNPKAFYNIKEIEDAWSKISHVKEYENEYIDSFIGNMIFEEINRICSSVSFLNFNKKKLINKIEYCNGYFYLKKYSDVRASKRICLYNWFIQRNYLYTIKLLTIINKFRLKIFNMSHE